MMAAAGIVLALVVLPLIIPALRLPGRSDPAHRLWLRFCARMARLGLERAPSEGAETFTCRIAKARPELASQVIEIGRIYNELRYGVSTRTPERLRRLRQCIARLRP